MFYVYILQSKTQPDEIYIGYTNDLKRRLEQHSSKASGYSQKYTPWGVDSYHAFSSQSKAKAFEQYLKSSSGWARSVLVNQTFEIK